MESDDALQPSRRTSPLVVISLVFSILTILVIVATLVASSVYEDYFTPPAGHSSVLMSSGAWMYYLVSCFVMFTLPVAIILAIIALLMIRNHPEKYGGRRLAWIALVIALLPIVGGMCILMIPLLMIPFASAPAPTMTPIIDLTTLSGEWTGTDTLSGGGKCLIAGGADGVTNRVRMLWTVQEDGDAVILMPDWPGVYPYKFTGKVNPDLSVELVLSSSAYCNSKQNSYNVAFESYIRQEGDRYRLELAGNEIWCPLLCTFQRRYEVGKER